ncbi:MAG: FtsW/RodA/SpoVE family cell cycle protein [Armatimonadota bacterium]
MAVAPALQPKPWYDARWLTYILGATMFGLVMAFSASYPNASRGSDDVPGDAFHFFRMHALFVVLGVIWLALMAWPRPVFHGRASIVAFILSLAGMALCVIICLATHERQRGAMQWLAVGPFRLQPSEFAKIFFIAYVAEKLSLGPVFGKTFPKVGYKILLAAAAFGLLLLIQGDQGMAVLMFLVMLAMCYLGGVPFKAVAVALGLAVFAFGGLVLTSPERIDRVLSWIDPVGHRTGAGYHILTMLVATSRGWIGGLGLGMCPDKWRAMPEPHTDSIFCVIGSELGLIGMEGLVLLLAVIVRRAFEVARWSGDNVGYFLASGLGIMLAIQALINMAVATNMMPVTGLTLPYISYGGSSLISCLMAAGMVMSVYRHNPAPLKED